MPKKQRGIIKNRLAQLALKKGTDEDRKITQHVVAEEAGIGLSTVSNYWNNKNVLDDKRVVAKLCIWLGIEPADFYYMQRSDSTDSEDDESKQLNALLLASA